MHHNRQQRRDQRHKLACDIELDNRDASVLAPKDRDSPAAARWHYACSSNGVAPTFHKYSECRYDHSVALEPQRARQSYLEHQATTSL
jgi:hypothetical protein